MQEGAVCDLEVNRYPSIKNCELEEQKEMQLCAPKHLTYIEAQSVGQQRLSKTQLLCTCEETFILFCKSSAFLPGQTVSYRICSPVWGLFLQ